MELAQLLKDYGPLILGGGSLVAALRLWIDVRATRRTQNNDLIKIAHDVAGGLIASLRTEVERLHKQLDEVEAEFATFRKAHDAMIADREAELALLRGENRELKATIEAYARLLDAHGIPHAPPPRPFFQLREGRVDAVLIDAPAP